MTTTQGCVFCNIVAGRAPATVVREWPDAIAIRPLTSAAVGHTLVIPRVHVQDIADDPANSAAAMIRAAELAGELPDVNVLTSRGAVASQTQFHLHWHVVPRAVGDGLPRYWPWDWERELPASPPLTTGQGPLKRTVGRPAVPHL